MNFIIRHELLFYISNFLQSVVTYKQQSVSLLSVGVQSQQK